MPDHPSAKIDTEHLRTWLLREEVSCETLTVDLVRRFNATLDLPGEEPVVGQAAPPLIHFCLAQPCVPSSDLGEDGHPRKGGFLPPVPLPRRMWAGGSIRFRGDLAVGDTVRRTSRIADITVKEGRSGVLCFVAVDHLLEVEGRIVIEERQDIVYREAATGGVILKPPPPQEALPAEDHRRVVAARPTLLFRYSALTFNSHRIHYDRPYARDVECYPGLVVQGPLQATLLLHFARDLQAATPTHFSFQGQSPLFDDDHIVICARRTEAGLSLWSKRENGPIAMRAEARWT